MTNIPLTPDNILFIPASKKRSRVSDNSIGKRKVLVQSARIYSITNDDNQCPLTYEKGEDKTETRYEPIDVPVQEEKEFLQEKEWRQSVPQGLDHPIKVQEKLKMILKERRISARTFATSLRIKYEALRRFMNLKPSENWNQENTAIYHQVRYALSGYSSSVFVSPARRHKAAARKLIRDILEIDIDTEKNIEEPLVYMSHQEIRAQMMNFLRVNHIPNNLLTSELNISYRSMQEFIKGNGKCEGKAYFALYNFLEKKRKYLNEIKSSERIMKEEAVSALQILAQHESKVWDEGIAALVLSELG